MDMLRKVSKVCMREKPTPVLIVKGNGTGNYGVPKVDEKRLKTDMVPYASAVGSSNITLTQFTYPGCFGNVQSIYIDHWNGVKDISLILKEISALKRL